MTRYANTVVDQYAQPVLGAQITVLDEDGGLAALTNDAGGSLSNPVATGAGGAFYFNAEPGTYTLQYRLSPTRNPFRIETVVLDGGAALIPYVPAGDNAIDRTVQAKLREFVSITDFGASSDATAAVNTAAIQAAMKYLMDRFDGGDDYYPGGPGDPTDFNDVDRRTGRIYIPAGTYKVLPNVLSGLTHPRAPYIGFEFFGEHRTSSVLLLQTGGAEAWFYNNGVGQERYQMMLFRSLNFRSDNWRYGGVAKVYSAGGPKQFRFEHCQFDYLQTLLYTTGSGNADLSKFSYCFGMFYGDLLVLDNDQSVQHDFIGSDIGSYGNIIRVRQHGGGNVNITNCSMDFIWHEDFSPADGNFIIVHDDDANLGPGNCTFSIKDTRIEVEAYRRSAGAPPIGLVKCPDTITAMPRILFDDVTFVNGSTYTIDADGMVTGSPEYRRITAVQIGRNKYVEFRNSVLLKTFFYELSGSRDTDSPNAGGILKFANCYDGIIGELPAADVALVGLHSRVTYIGSAGRAITEGMAEHTTGASNERKLLDADPNWRRSFAREPSSTMKICSFKHYDNGWPFTTGATNDQYLDIPPGFAPLQIYIRKPATGALTDAYQLHIGNADKSVTFGSSTLAQFKDEHVIDLSHLELSGYSRIRLWATGAGANFQSGGTAYVRYV